MLKSLLLTLMSLAKKVVYMGNLISYYMHSVSMHNTIHWDTKNHNLK